MALKDIVPEEIEGIPTDVVEIGEIRALSCTELPGSAAASGLDPKKKYRPFLAGVSAMNYKGTACTLGWFAKDKTDGELVILANNHCVARENTAKIGEAYLQPSPHDGGTMSDKIGKLKRFVPLRYASYRCPFRSVFGLRNWWRKRDPPENIVDLGIVGSLVSTPRLEILNIGKVYGKRDPEVGDVVKKCGRTTGLTRGGNVIGVHWSGSVQYGRGEVWFTDCAIIRKVGFSAGGDSSSGIVTDEAKSKVLGLLFAGSDTHTIFCKLSNIERVGEVEVICNP